jgi:molecular chaperone Hsp33
MGAVITESARAVETVHRALPLAAAAMGRLMVGAAFLSADFKGDEFVHLETDGGGPLGRVIAEGYADGMLRARVDHPDVSLPLRPDGKLAVGQAVGRDGRLLVRRHLDNGGIYNSYVPLQSGEIGADLAHYFTESEQVPSAVAVGVLVVRDGHVLGAGGVLVQTLPDAPRTLVDDVEERLHALGSVSYPVADGATAEDLIRRILPEPIQFGEPARVRFDCRCDRSDLKPLLLTLPSEERKEMAKTGGAEVVCQYCRTAYRYGTTDLGLAPQA